MARPTALAPLGAVFRSIGSTLEGIGAGIADTSSREKLSRHREVMGLPNMAPAISDNCFVAPSANIVGNVKVGSRSNVWYGAIVKGDLSEISIGANSSIKDRAIIAPSSAGSVRIGNSVLVGQGAVIGNATLQDSSVIGMGAVIGDGAVVEAGAYVAPGSTVEAGATVPAGKVFSGTKVVRELTSEESTRLAASCEALTQLGAKHAEEAYKGFLEIEQDKTDAKWQFERTLDSDGALGLLEKNPRAQVW